jgi:hypothetical protein
MTALDDARGLAADAAKSIDWAARMLDIAKGVAH